MNNYKKNWKWLSITVTLVMFLSIYLGKQAYDKHLQYVRYTKIKEALQLVSLNLNKGNNAVYDVSNNLTKGTHAVTKLDTYTKTVHTVIAHLNY